MNSAVEQLRREALECLTQNILPFWLDNMQDHEHGGWYGRMDGHGTLYAHAEKGAILNARILWSFAAAYRVLRRPEYLQAATRTKDYFLRHFIDPEHGGVYWSVDYMGRPLDTKKQFYAIGFAIYGLSEYARATGDEEALRASLSLFDDVERHAVLERFMERFVRLFGQITDGSPDALDALHCRYKSLLYRLGQEHGYSDKDGTFRATLTDVEPSGHLVLQDSNGTTRRYAFKEVKYII